jgi:hypothetical protein
VDIAATSANGDIVLEHPIAATRLRDGTIVVADISARMLRFFDPSGRYLASLGRPGSGPGEFESVYWLGQCHTDSLFVWDLTLQRMTILNSVGAFVRQFQVAPAREFAATPLALACSRSGIIAFLSLPPLRILNQVPRGQLFFRLNAPLALIDTHGNVSRTLGSVQSGEYVAIRGTAPRPLGKSTSIAVSGDKV